MNIECRMSNVEVGGNAKGDTAARTGERIVRILLPSDTPHPTVATQSSTFDIRHSTFDIRYSTFSLPLSPLPPFPPLFLPISP